MSDCGKECCRGAYAEDRAFTAELKRRGLVAVPPEYMTRLAALEALRAEVLRLNGLDNSPGFGEWRRIIELAEKAGDK